MSQPNAANVVVAVTGAVYVADVGATAPTGANDPLGPEWSHLGYISSDGVTEAHTVSSDALQAWQNSQTVRTLISKYQVNYTFQCMETKRSVLERYYGLDPAKTGVVAGAGGPGLYEPTYASLYPGTPGGMNAYVIEPHGIQHMAMVVDVIDHTTMVIRRYAPRVAFAERGEVKMSVSEAMAYPFDLEALPDPTLGGSVQVFYSRLL
jgi:hypothetical protein